MRAKNFPESFRFAVAGLIYAFRTQRNVKFHVLAALLVFCLSSYLKLSRTELLFVVFATLLVIITEMVNTAIEAAVDLAVGENLNPLAKIAKDVAAGAVLVAAVNALAVAGLVLWPALRRQ